MAQPTKRKFRVQWTIGEKLWTAGHGAAFFKDQQPVSLVIPPPPLPNVATQNARPALYNEDFGRERDIEELQNEDEADELMLSGEQHVVQISPDVNPLEPHGQKWEVLDAGIPVCQRAAAGLGMNDLRIKWSNQPYSVEDCFNIMHVSTQLLQPCHRSDKCKSPSQCQEFHKA
eukprot:Em0005g1404a